MAMLVLTSHVTLMHFRPRIHLREMVDLKLNVVAHMACWRRTERADCWLAGFRSGENKTIV